MNRAPSEHTIIRTRITNTAILAIQDKSLIFRIKSQMTETPQGARRKRSFSLQGSQDTRRPLLHRVKSHAIIIDDVYYCRIIVPSPQGTHALNVRAAIHDLSSNPRLSVHNEGIRYSWLTAPHLV